MSLLQLKSDKSSFTQALKQVFYIHKNIVADLHAKLDIVSSECRILKARSKNLESSKECAICIQKDKRNETLQEHFNRLLQDRDTTIRTLTAMLEAIDCDSSSRSFSKEEAMRPPEIEQSSKIPTLDRSELQELTDCPDLSVSKTRVDICDSRRHQITSSAAGEKNVNVIDACSSHHKLSLNRPDKRFSRYTEEQQELKRLKISSLPEKADKTLISASKPEESFSVTTTENVLVPDTAYSHPQKQETLLSCCGEKKGGPRGEDNHVWHSFVVPETVALESSLISSDEDDSQLCQVGDNSVTVTCVEQREATPTVIPTSVMVNVIRSHENDTEKKIVPAINGGTRCTKAQILKNTSNESDVINTVEKQLKAEMLSEINLLVEENLNSSNDLKHCKDANQQIYNSLSERQRSKVCMNTPQIRGKIPYDSFGHLQSSIEVHQAANIEQLDNSMSRADKVDGDTVSDVDITIKAIESDSHQTDIQSNVSLNTVQGAKISSEPLRCQYSSSINASNNQNQAKDCKISYPELKCSDSLSYSVSKKVPGYSIFSKQANGSLNPEIFLTEYMDSEVMTMKGNDTEWNVVLDETIAPALVGPSPRTGSDLNSSRLAGRVAPGVSSHNPFSIVTEESPTQVEIMEAENQEENMTHCEVVDDSDLSVSSGEADDMIEASPQHKLQNLSRLHGSMSSIPSSYRFVHKRPQSFTRGTGKPTQITLTTNDKSLDPKEPDVKHTQSLDKRGSQLESFDHPESNQVTSVQTLIDSFDRVEKLEKQEEFPHISVVRKRSERQKLDGFSCKQCYEYYKKSGLSEEEIQQKKNECSRHRERYCAPQTPEHFWSLGFPDTAEMLERKRKFSPSESQTAVDKAPRRRHRLEKKF